MLRYEKAEDVASAFGMVPHPEGGYFIEIYRSGSLPMTTKGQTDFDVSTHYNNSSQRTGTTAVIPKRSYEALALAPGRESRRPDGDIRRNCLTSIMWMPVISNPNLPLAINLSDHVHYYHGGNPFQYIMYNPQTTEVYTEILGPVVTEGQKLQVAVPGGFWKCGRMINTGECDFSLIGEAVAPGFDFHDFSWVTKSDVLSISNRNDRTLLLEFVNEEADELSGKEVEDSEKYYSPVDTDSDN